MSSHLNALLFECLYLLKISKFWGNLKNYQTFHVSKNYQVMLVDNLKTDISEFLCVYIFISFLYLCLDYNLPLVC
jgi:hypothetical protein